MKAHVKMAIVTPGVTYHPLFFPKGSRILDKLLQTLGRFSHQTRSLVEMPLQVIG